MAIKAGVVASDEREGDRRMLLNYGHTLAHALEASAFDPDAGLDLRHGEAVAIGLVFAALLASGSAASTTQRVELHRRVVGGFDLARAARLGRPGAAGLVHGPGQEGPPGPDLRPRRTRRGRGGPGRRRRTTWSLPWRRWIRTR